MFYNGWQCAACSEKYKSKVGICVQCNSKGCTLTCRPFSTNPACLTPRPKRAKQRKKQRKTRRAL
jgi:hypothetical protein